MPEPWYPLARRIPGAAAGYTRGHTSMVSAVAHYTVGRDSSGPAYLGNLFQFLITRDGRVLQGAECDARCWHAGNPYNSRGPGLEVEYHPDYDDAVFTDAQRDATQALIQWLESEWGIPAEYYDDPGDKRSDWHGTISHRSVVSDADVHSDYWPEADAAIIFAYAPEPAPIPPSRRKLDMWAFLILFDHDKSSTYIAGVADTIWIDVHGPQKAYGFPMDELNYVQWDPAGIDTKILSQAHVPKIEWIRTKFDVFG